MTSRLVSSRIATGNIISLPPHEPVQVDTAWLAFNFVFYTTHIDSRVRPLPDIRQKGVYDTEKSGRGCLVS